MSEKVEKKIHGSKDSQGWTTECIERHHKWFFVEFNLAMININLFVKEAVFVCPDCGKIRRVELASGSKEALLQNWLDCATAKKGGNQK